MGIRYPIPVLLYLLLLLATVAAYWRKQDGQPGCGGNRTGPCLCSGQGNGRSMVGTDKRVRIEELRLIYQNCTRVYGNVEITHLTLQPNETLDFFDNIEEIIGYILIYNVNNVERISFKNLRIIWGDHLFEDHAIRIITSRHLSVLSMPNLKTVHQGRVGIEKANNMCYFKKRVKFEEILDLNLDRLKLEYYNSSVCTKHEYSCHPSCGGHCWGPGEQDCQTVYRTVCPELCESNMCYKVNATGELRCCDNQCVAGCVGSQATDCYYCQKHRQCDNPKNCRCVEQCTARSKYDHKEGIVVPNPAGYYTNGRYCEKECPVERLIQNDICVEHCSPGHYYDVEREDRQCRKCEGECPRVCKFDQRINAVTIQQLNNCTEIEGKIVIDGEAFTEHDYDAGRDVGMSVRVRPLTMDDLDILKSVRIVTEYVYIALFQTKLNVRSLDFLENLEIIEGRRGVNHDKQSLIITNCDHLEYLGLKKLREIKKGDLVISRNLEMCYGNSIKWEEIVKGKNATVNVKENGDKERCESDGRVCDESCNPAHGCWGPGNDQCRRCRLWTQEGRCVEKCAKIGFYPNKSTNSCERCYAECETCTGPTEKDCLSCRNLKLYVPMRKHGHVAVVPQEDDPDDIYDDEQIEQRWIQEHERMKAMEEKDRPKPRWFRETEMEDGDYVSTISSVILDKRPKELRCFAECPSKHYFVQDGECKRCHRSCKDNGCTGHLNELGPGGCNNCTHAQVETPLVSNNTDVVLRCLWNPRGAHPGDVCKNNDLLDHFVDVSHRLPGVLEYVCRPCHEQCSSCSSFGTSLTVNSCLCRHYISRGSRPFPRREGDKKTESKPMETKETCTADCFKGFYKVQEMSETGPGRCNMCHVSCARDRENNSSCSGPTEHDCFGCAADYFAIEDKTKPTRTCVVVCPDGMFPYHADMHCYNSNYELMNKIRNGVLIATGITILLLLIIVGCCVWLRARKLKQELDQEKAVNAPEIPELIPMDLHQVRPNMERMPLMMNTELVRSARELGAGAFGIVYAGCWMPPGKKIKVPVAIKLVRDPSGRAQSEMVEEAAKMAMMRHENLLRIVGVCMSGEDLQLVTLLRPLGNLLKFMQKHRSNLGGQEMMLYAYQIASGMKYLADQRVVHRDLAARNVLVKNHQHVEITDFGLARMMDYDSDSVQVGEGKVALKWLAIEALEKQIYTTATDVWAFGVTVWEILTYGESPYPKMTPHAIKDALISGQRLSQPNNCSITLYQTLLQCWMEKPDSRPSFMILKDTFRNFARAPHAVVVDSQLIIDTVNLGIPSQRDLIEDIIETKDFEDPEHYFDSEPNTPGFLPHSGDGVFTNPMFRRMDSTSTRYASDPMGDRQEFGMNDDNYLVPTSKAAESAGATMYTPVVVNENGDTALISSSEYYNEVGSESEYLNETKLARLHKKRDTFPENRRPIALSAIEEDESSVMEKESCL